MPLNLSFTHIIVMLVVALVVLGPERLPEAARSMAKWIGELRRMSTGLQAEVRDTFGEFAEPFSDLVSTVTGGVMAATSAPEAAAPPAPSPTLPSLEPANGHAPPGHWLAALPALRPTEPATGTFSPGPPLAGPVFTPLGIPEPGSFTPRP